MDKIKLFSPKENHLLVRGTNPNRRRALANKKVLMLLKIQFLEGLKRYALFQNSPLKAVYVFSKRLDINKNGVGTGNSSMICFAWFVWEQGYTGKPEIRWLL